MLPLLIECSSAIELLYTFRAIDYRKYPREKEYAIFKHLNQVFATGRRLE